MDNRKIWDRLVVLIMLFWGIGKMRDGQNIDKLRIIEYNNCQTNKLLANPGKPGGAKLRGPVKW